MERKIQISEPWDFIHPCGSNEFTVHGIGIVKGPDKLNWAKEYYLAEVDEPFVINGEIVKQLICSPRYQGDTLEKACKEECIVGIARIVAGHELSCGDRVDDKKVVYFAIGKIR